MPAVKTQSVIFERSKWTLPRAKKWLKKHKYKTTKVDTTAKFFRFRQMNPNQFKKFRTLSIGRGG